MKTIPVYTRTITRLADFHTPAGMYARVRRHFPETMLFESNEYQSAGHGCSVICITPIARFQSLRGSVTASIEVSNTASVQQKLHEFLHSFVMIDESEVSKHNGFFGYTSYCAVQHFEQITFNPKKYTQESQTAEIPELLYRLFKIVIVVEHQNHRITITQNSLNQKIHSDETLLQIFSIICEPLTTGYSFRQIGDEKSSCSDQDFAAQIAVLQEHIARGDIFQAVLSRRFTQEFKGDDFQVYRALRSINPSPYLFYFDFGCFRLFGSSPETALIVENNKAILNPIAGTVARTGCPVEDNERTQRLISDRKEQSEHVMLVDLARNDLSRNCYPVHVEAFQDIHSYSHVTHLVSSVTGTPLKDATSDNIFFNVFPAGTVSGAPKYRAMELLDQLEGDARSFYGGAIGFFGFDGSCQHALTIRSFLSQHNQLIYQAGAGIVSMSDPQKETEEVHAKLKPLRLAINQGVHINE